MVNKTEQEIRHLDNRRKAIGERYFKKNKSLSAMERQELQMLAWKVCKLKRKKINK